jgi:hypothetical protein
MQPGLIISVLGYRSDNLLLEEKDKSPPHPGAERTKRHKFLSISVCCQKDAEAATLLISLIKS